MTFAQQLLQVAMGRRDDPNVDRDRISAADGPHLVFLQHAQQFHLQTHRHVADLVEEQSAALGRLEQTLVLARRPRERTFLVTEQFGLEEILRHRRTVDGHEWFVVPRARIVDRPREQLLARAALARDQHAGVGRRHHLGLLQHFLHALVTRDDFGRPAFLDFGRAGHLERLFDRHLEFVLVDRLGQEAECTALRCDDGVRNRAVRRDDHDAQAGRARLQFLEKADAVHLVHTQVGNDEIRAEAVQRRQCLVRALDGLDVITFGAQANGQQAQQTRVVVDEEDLAFGMSLDSGHER